LACDLAFLREKYNAATHPIAIARMATITVIIMFILIDKILNKRATIGIKRIMLAISIVHHHS